MENNSMHELVIILDFGSQYTQLIARRIREAGVYCEILPYNTPSDVIISRHPRGLILSGSPSSVYEKDAPHPAANLFEITECPILGICYGLQVMAVEMGGEVEPSKFREYGYAKLQILEASSPLFKDLPAEIDVWMSHGDHVITPPPGFRVAARTSDALNAFENLNKRIFGLQFHPEVAHTALGSRILRNFLANVCDCRFDWSPRAVIEDQVNKISEQLNESDQVICGLSGGVDSTVAAALVNQAIGRRQTCLFVDTGLLRKDEFNNTLALFRQHLDLTVLGVDGSPLFLSSLSGITEPERKRKIIGRIFIEIFEQEAQKLGEVKFLVQGTLYPDVIESVSLKGPSAVIKSHHNVGGLPSQMNLKLIEPLRELFKDEVREIGRELGIPSELLERHPFPGPGLAVRIIGEVTPERVSLLQEADQIVDEELRLAGLYNAVWQAFPVLLPIDTVGVMGDERTYERVVAVRAVTSVDGMTADWARLPHDVLARISTRLVSEVRGVNRVVYDITSKPPGTIEWE